MRIPPSSKVRGGAVNSGRCKRKLDAGASVTVTGYAKANATLAESRAAVVANFLARRVSLHATLATVTNKAVNMARVITRKQ